MKKAIERIQLNNGDIETLFVDGDVFNLEKTKPNFLLSDVVFNLHDCVIIKGKKRDGKKVCINLIVDYIWEGD